VVNKESDLYGKVFESMYDGTLASEGPWQALVTFQQLIVLADQDGVVDMTASAISRRTSIPLEIIKAGLDVLARPDPDSRTPDEDGRRIVCLESHRDWGWQIVNHRKYQQMRNAAERREYLRVAQAERRARLKAEAVNTCQQSQQLSAPVSTSTPKDTYKDEDAEERDAGLAPSGPAPSASVPAPPQDFLGDESEKANPRARMKLAEKWELSEKWGLDAEALGWTVAEILREAEKFRQYFCSGKGAGTRRTVKGWRQSWSNWLGNAEKYKGK